MLVLKIKNPKLSENPVAEAYKLYGHKPPTLEKVYNGFLIKLKGGYYIPLYPQIRGKLVKSNNPLFNAYILRSLLTRTVHSFQSLQIEKIHQLPPQSINEFVSDEVLKLLLGLKVDEIVSESFTRLFNSDELNVAIKRFVRSVYKDFDNFDRFSRLVKSNNDKSKIKVIRLLSVAQGLVGYVTPIIHGRGVLPFNMGIIGGSCVMFSVNNLGQFEKYSKQLGVNDCRVVFLDMVPPTRFILFSNLYGIYKGEVVATTKYMKNLVEWHEGIVLDSMLDLLGRGRHFV